jgi:hypothetical protein
LKIGFRVGPPLALEAVLPNNEGENGNGSDSSHNSSGNGTDIWLARRSSGGHGVNCADNLGALIAGLGRLHADLVGRADYTVAGQRRLVALDAALGEVEDILDV